MGIQANHADDVSVFLAMIWRQSDTKTYNGGPKARDQSHISNLLQRQYHDTETVDPGFIFSLIVLGRVVNSLVTVDIIQEPAIGAMMRVRYRMLSKYEEAVGDNPGAKVL